LCYPAALAAQLTAA
jgi:chromosome segregation ATPase